MSDDTTPDLLDLMAEALTVSFTGHPQRRFQALAANRVLAERMWPPVQAALDQRDASLAKSRAGCDSLRNRIRELEQAACAGCMTREQQRDAAMEFSRLNGVKTEKVKAAWYREKERAEQAEAELIAIKGSNSGPYWRLRSDRHEAERDRLETAWWSARIGRARARESHRRARAVAQIRGSEVADLKRRRTELIIEIDQLKAAAQAEMRAANRWMAEANQAEATIGRVRAFAENLAENGPVWDGDNSAVGSDLLKILDQPAPPSAVCTCNSNLMSIEVAAGSCVVTEGAPDLPAVREFAAEHDPRGEGS